jgi:hypothetical protein
MLQFFFHQQKNNKLKNLRVWSTLSNIYENWDASDQLNWRSDERMKIWQLIIELNF